MNVLIVCSGNHVDFNFMIHQAFIYEQVEMVKEKYNIDYDTFFIRGKGIFGYLKNIKRLRIKIKENNYNLIHAHNLSSGLLSRFQFYLPVIVTFHGSDINLKIQRIFSKLLSRIISNGIVVSNKLYTLLNNKRNISVVPCGVDTRMFYPMNQSTARGNLNINSRKKIVLFASAFNRKIKNYSLAKMALDQLTEINFEVMELHRKSREEVNVLMNAADLLLMTSFSEGSPQVIKEAMACNLPIVSTDVGDVQEVIGDTEGCFISSFDPVEVSRNIMLALNYGKRTIGREKILTYRNEIIARKIYNIYKKVRKTH